MCLSCGYYRGRQVMDLAASKEKREKRMADKKESIRAQSSSSDTSATGAAEQK